MRLIKISSNCCRIQRRTTGMHHKVIPPFSQKMIYYQGMKSLQLFLLALRIEAIYAIYRIETPVETNIIVSNLPEFAAIFHCESEMPLNPKNRCSVW
ncbi:hypothetical protein ANCCAN_01079 [Ancylostoma caninum]|uniref:Peptidase M13 C-terminal domain-containing protein n=1 Tax=Ancylostoma caninum TaxID=29170 RepID=A0A368H7X1_ANCCA|nr:hypothetical protein ANCCAN_01079 [Ancylostoma caninum]